MPKLKRRPDSVVDIPRENVELEESATQYNRSATRACRGVCPANTPQLPQLKKGLGRPSAVAASSRVICERAWATASSKLSNKWLG